MLRHDAGGLLRKRTPQVLGSWGQFLHDSEYWIRTTLRSFRGRGVDVLRAGSAWIANVPFLRRKLVTAKVFEQRIKVCVLGATCLRIHLELDDAFGNGARLLG